MAWMQSAANMSPTSIPLFGSIAPSSRVVMGLTESYDAPVLVHCDAGKDRTGVSIALARLVAGHTWSSIRDDFERGYVRDTAEVTTLLRDSPSIVQRSVRAALETSGPALYISLSHVNGKATRPPVVVLCGGPGVGKTSTARLLVKRIAAVRVNTDEMATAILTGDPACTPEIALLRARRSLPERILLLNKLASPIIVDGTLADQLTWKDLSATAEWCNRPLVAFALRVPVAIATGRLLDGRPETSRGRLAAGDRVMIHTKASIESAHRSADETYRTISTDIETIDSGNASSRNVSERIEEILISSGLLDRR